MVEQANVNITSKLDVEILVARKLADGSPDVEETIPGRGDGTISLPSLEVYLLITPARYVDTGTCPFNVTYNEDLISWEKMDGQWKVKLTANTAKPEVPTDVNIEIGEEPPMP